MTKKICSTCNRILPIEDFETSSNKKGTFTRAVCRTCNQGKREAHNSKTPYNYLTYLTTQLKSTRRDSGIEWEIDKDYIHKIWDKQKGKCNITGLNMTWSKGNGVIRYSASIDRMNSNVGYVIGNIQLVCSMINIMKNNLSDSELYWWSKAIVEHKEKHIEN